MSSFDDRDDVRLLRVREHLRTGFWAVPAVCFLAAVVLSLVTLWLDDHVVDDWPGTFRGSADGARAVLSTIASAMITFTGLVFSITIVVLQLTSTQFSPRVLRTFLRDRSTQASLGVFVATFAYALLVLRGVRSETTDDLVPALSISIAFLLVLVSLAMFVHYIHHIARSIRASSIIASIGAETRRTIAALYPTALPPEPTAGTGRAPDAAAARVIPSAKEPGVVLGYDDDRLVEVARRAGCTIHLVPAVGDFVPEGAPLFEVLGPAEGLDEAAACAAVALGSERTMQQDVAFGFRQLVDIAERGLSPAVNDPTTAVQCLDQIHDLLRRLAVRPFPAGRSRDADGVVRLVVPVASWDDYVALAIDEVRHFGARSVQVARRLHAALEDLLTVAPPERRPVLETQLRLLDASVTRAFPDVEDRVAATHPDAQGLGG